MSEENVPCDICHGTGIYTQALAYEDDSGVVQHDESHTTCHGCNGTGNRRVRRRVRLGDHLFAITPKYCYVCGMTLTPEATRVAQIDGGETIIRICGRDDCADDERIYKLIGSAADYERWLNERWLVEHGGPDFDL